MASPALNIDIKTERENHYEINNKIGIIPKPENARNFIRPFSYPWNWEVYSFRYPAEVRKKLIYEDAKHLQTTGDYHSSTKAIVNL